MSASELSSSLPATLASLTRPLASHLSTQSRAALVVRQSLIIRRSDHGFKRLVQLRSLDAQCEMRPLGKDLFVFQRCTKEIPARLRFDRNDRGDIVGMTIMRYDLSRKFCKKIP